jgi:hypothetical protein
MIAKTDRARKTMTEEIQVAGSELLDRIRTLLSEGRVRHIRVKSPTGELYFELPLAVGVLGGAALAVASPWLAMAGSLAGLVASVKIEVVRENDEMVAVVEPTLHAERPVTDRASAARLTPRVAKKPKPTAAPAKRGGAVAKPSAAKPARGRSGSSKRGSASSRPAAKSGRGKTTPSGRR